MGLTRFSGPAFGAKAMLFCSSPGTLSTGATTTTFAKTVVPQTEDWFITDIAMFCSTNSSNSQVKVKNSIAGVNTTFGVINTGASSVGINVVTAVGASGGSVAAGVSPGTSSGAIGFYAPSGSSLRCVSTCVNPLAGLHLALHGWRQWVSIGNQDVLGVYNTSTRSFGN